jgi:hypothetical protein
LYLIRNEKYPDFPLRHRKTFEKDNGVIYNSMVREYTHTELDLCSTYCSCQGDTLDDVVINGKILRPNCWLLTYDCMIQKNAISTAVTRIRYIDQLKIINRQY